MTAGGRDTEVSTVSDGVKGGNDGVELTKHKGDEVEGGDGKGPCSFVKEMYDSCFLEWYNNDYLKVDSKLISQQSMIETHSVVRFRSDLLFVLASTVSFVFTVITLMC
mmetsp:Transcript_11644/g.21083  ORF Transcript_11644/g.21083 Transcript_11644/m.21083 type:complete len:108 (-) Transcript_11644:2445-2768(-)